MSDGILPCGNVLVNTVVSPCTFSGVSLMSGYRNTYLLPPDINECATGVDECTFSELCRDTVGSYQCSCPAGYTLAADGKTCNGEVN